jgi:hypothetical protein
MLKPHQVSPENAEKSKDWIANRGGIAIWKSINLSNPGASWSTPALQLERSPLTGNFEPTTKPTWEAASEPERIIREVGEVLVVVPREVKRFHVGIRLGSQGLTYKLTDGATRKVHAAVAKANRDFAEQRKVATDSIDEAWYEFDYDTQEAVIYIPDQMIPLTEWK